MHHWIFVTGYPSKWLSRRTEVPKMRWKEGANITKSRRYLDLSGTNTFSTSRKKKLKKSAINHKISEINSCEIVLYGECFIAISRDFFASINKIFILARGIGTRLSFYEV